METKPRLTAGFTVALSTVESRPEMAAAPSSDMGTDYSILNLFQFRLKTETDSWVYALEAYKLTFYTDISEHFGLVIYYYLKNYRSSSINACRYSFTPNKNKHHRNCVKMWTQY